MRHRALKMARHLPIHATFFDRSAAVQQSGVFYLSLLYTLV